MNYGTDQPFDCNMPQVYVFLLLFPDNVNGLNNKKENG